jgi:hypothetical protein
MDAPERPKYFYLFPEGKDIKIREMTDMQADKLLKQGKSWIGIPKKTRSDAEALRRQLLERQD